MDSIPQFWLTADPEHLNERVSVLDTHRLTVCSAADLATVRTVLTAQVLGAAGAAQQVQSICAGLGTGN